MTFSSRYIRAIACFLAFGLFAVPAGAQRPKKTAKPDTEIKFATLAPEGSAWMKVMHALDDDVRAATDNRVGFKFYATGVQGDEKDVLRKMRIGQIHGGGFTGLGLGTIVPDFRAIEVPFMYRNTDEVDYVREKMQQYYIDAFDKKGYVFLGWGDAGFVYIYSNTKIESPADLQKPKVWTWAGDPLAQIFFDAFHVSPIPLALPDVLTSLQMGVVDAVYGPPLGMIAFQWFTRVKYMIDVPITYGFGGMLVSKKALKKVSPSDLEILKEIAQKRSLELVAKIREQNHESIDAMRDEGVEVVKVPDAVMNDFFKTGRAAWKNGYGKLYSKEVLERVIATVEEYRTNQESASQ